MAVDCHMHMVLDGQYWKAAIGRHEKEPDVRFIRQILAIYQSLGYTYLRDGGDRWGAGAQARALSPEYGIRYRTPLAPISKKGHYGGFIGLQFDSWDEYAALLRKTKADGADFIKLMISGLMDFDQFGRLSEPGLDAQTVQRMVSMARDTGLSVMAHCNGARTAQTAALAGVHSIEHGAYLDSEALACMAQQGTVWVPTVSTIANLRGKGRFREAAVQAIFQSASENLRKFAGMGGLIAVGSDAGAWAVPHGCQTEEALLTEILGAGAENILAVGNKKILELF